MNITQQIIGYLRARALVMATVETCTAGHIAAMLADASGASQCLDTGLVIHERALATLPFVDARTIEQAGLISVAVAREIAEGVLARGHANVALVSLGLPVPEEAESVEHCLAWACLHRTQIHSHGETVILRGRRNEIRRSIARRALMGVPRFVDSVLAQYAQ